MYSQVTPDKLENVAFSRRLCLPSTLIRRQNGASQKHSSNRRNLKTPAFRFSVDRQTDRTDTILKTGLFENESFIVIM